MEVPFEGNVALSIGQFIRTLSSFSRESDVVVYDRELGVYRNISEEDIDYVILQVQDGKKQAVGINLLDIRADLSAQSKEDNWYDLGIDTQVKRTVEKANEMAYAISEIFPEDGDYIAQNIPTLAAFAEVKAKALNALCVMIENLTIMKQVVKYEKEQNNKPPADQNVTNSQIIVTKNGIEGLDGEHGKDDESDAPTRA